MAEGLISAAADVLLDSLVGTYDFIKLHTGAPGAAATSNAATETTRKAITWGSASGGTVSSSAQVQWTNVAGSEDYTHCSFWDASTAGAVGFTGTVTANPVTAGDTFTVASGDIDASFSVAS